ncbi:MAG: Clp protease N-terminal domain-containing protein [Candidatus Competibacteraceae bacterium]
MEFLSVVEQRQSSDPTNLVLAHDVGLAHYWQAKKQYSDAQAIVHWQRVIANWAMVLENEAYWQAWSAERGQVYGKDITDEPIAGAREKLRETLSGELAEASQQLTTATSNPHLEAAFYLEIETIRLLRQSGGLPLSGGGPLYCGPLQARQWSMESQVAAFFQQHSIFARQSQDSLSVILASIPGDTEQTPTAERFPGWRLQLCYSQLGIAWIYLERRQPHHTLNVLAAIRCPACRPAPDAQTDPTTDSEPVRCRDDCKDFDRLNPAYSAIVGGRELYYRHAVELTVCAHLALAYQGLVTTPADIEGSLQHLRAALTVSERIGIHVALKEVLAGRVLLWSDGLGKAERWEEAIALLEGTSWLFGQDERWQGKLAGLLNIRGVQHANENRWAEAVVDLRRACQLNPYVPLFRDNFRNALQGYANACYEAGDAERARTLLDEAIAVGKAPAPAPAGTPNFTEPTKSPATEFIWKPNELASPVLFDEKGLLRYELFDDSGCAVLGQAQQEAAALGENELRPRALLLALTKVANREIIHLLQQLKVAPQQLQDQLQTAVTGALDHADQGRLAQVTKLSQFDMWPSTCRTLELALEIAQYDQGLIGERHLLYGLLVGGGAAGLLHKAGVDANQILERVIWD